MSNMSDILEYRNVIYSAKYDKTFTDSWLVFKDSFLINNDKVISICENSDIFINILLTLRSNGYDFINIARNVTEISGTMNGEKLKILNEYEAMNAFHFDSITLEYYDNSVYFTDDLKLIVIADSDSFYMASSKDFLRTLLSVDEIFGLDAWFYETDRLDEAYCRICLELYSNFFYSKRVGIDDLHIIEDENITRYLEQSRGG
ncbi:hypothetical protein AGMMS49941_12520 [Deferribacterales bacterium]|nr:hypothetical protein AGMMS49941_12520 [Deferribacterales bacterium]